MSYEKTNWQTGDVVTAEKLNNIENGVDGLYTTDSPIFVILENDNTLSKTCGEIINAINAHKFCVVFLDPVVEDGLYAVNVFVSNVWTDFEDNNRYKVTVTDGETASYYTANTVDDYPAR